MIPASSRLQMQAALVFLIGCILTGQRCRTAILKAGSACPDCANLVSVLEQSLLSQFHWPAATAPNPSFVAISLCSFMDDHSRSADGFAT